MTPLNFRTRLFYFLAVCACCLMMGYNLFAQTFRGISGSITACGTTVSCSILIPPSYTTSDLVPGYGLDPNNPPTASTTSGNIMIFDHRYGDARMATNPTGYTVGLITSPDAWLFNYYTKRSAMQIVNPLYILQNSWDGGTNSENSSLNYYDKTTWMPLNLVNYSHTPGQHITATFNAQSMSTGDTAGLTNYVTCYGGFNAQADEGCEAQDNQVFQGNVEYQGTLTGSPTTGGSSITVSVTQGNNTQGAGRYVVKTNAGTISTGTISAVTPVYQALTTITGTSTNWPVSTAVASLGTNVTGPGSATVTPSTFTIGSMTNITTSSLVCVADGAAFEIVKPTAVNSPNFTATFTRAHPSTATIGVGGLCGTLLDLTADDVTNSTFTTKLQYISGTLHFAWPVVASTSATSLQLYVAGGGGYQQIVTRWNASTANGYVLYPFAEVTSVQQNGGLSNVLQLGPNNVTWTAGDSISEFLYPSGDFHFGNYVVESYYPNFPLAGGGFSLIYNMPLQGNDTMFSLTNNAPVSMYKVNGGQYDGPFGIHISGQTRFGISVDIPSDQFVFSTGCTTLCLSTINVFAAKNNSYYDFLQYDEMNARWMITANSNNKQYTFGSTVFTTPFANVSMNQDTAGVGYVATQSLRTGTSTNTDLSGELSFSAASTATYTMLGAYNSHEECWAIPQFDPGSGNRMWITYTGTTSFTVNFSSAVTGSVTYGCLARN